MVMDYKQYFIVILVLLIDTESAMELKSYTACYGGVGLQNYLQPSCPAGQKIAIMAVYTLAKYKSTGCPQIQTLPGDDPACCQYDVTDCSDLYDSGPYRNYYEACNGKSFCQIQVSWIDIPSYCNSSVYFERTNYMKMNYYCVSDQAVDPCTDLTTSDSPTFFWNTGYPAEMTSTSKSCTCSIEMSCDTTVELTAIDLQLEYAENCNQSFTVTDGSFLSTFDCTNNNDFLPQVIYTSSGHFMKILFENNLGTTGGKFLIQVKGTNPTGEVTLSCGASALTVSSQNPSSLPTCPVEGDTITNLSTSGPSTQTENSTTLTAMSTKDTTTLTSMSTKNSTTPTAMSTEDSTTLTVMSTENSSTLTAMSTEDSTALTSMLTEKSTTFTALSNEDSTTLTSMSTENSTTLTAMSTEDSTTLTTMSTENSTTTALSTEDSTTLTSISTENSTMLTSMSTENSTTPTAMSTEDSTTLTSMSTEKSTTPTAISTEDSTTLTAKLTDSSTVSTSISHNVQTKYSTTANVLTTVSSTATTIALTTDSSTASPITLLNVQTENSTTLTAQTTEDFKTSTALTTEDSTTPTAQTTEDFTTKTARTTQDFITSTARTTRDFTKLSDTSRDSTTLSLSTQDATTSGFSLNMTTMLNVFIESTSDLASDHSTPPQTSTYSPTVTATEPCCKDSNTTKETHISTSSTDTESYLIPVLISVVVAVMVIVVLFGIFCNYLKRRRTRSSAISFPLYKF